MRGFQHVMVGVVVCALAHDAVANGPRSEILGGLATKPGDYPTVVGLRIGGGICTGTLIHREWVLTAAHCIAPAVVQLETQAQVTAATRVVLDASSLLSGGGKVIRAKRTLPHPEFSIEALGKHDIGLIQLATPVTDREPSPVNMIAARAPAGTSVTMVGFGKTDPANAGSAGTQFVVQERVAIACSDLELDDDAVLCFSQVDGKGKCEGDSGGPSFAVIDGKPTVVGVTSFGDQGCAQIGIDSRPGFDRTFLRGHMGMALAECTQDSECDGGLVCQERACIPAPFTPGGLGATCEAATACATSQCGKVGEDQLCVASCSMAQAGASVCPSGFTCLSSGANADAGACWPAAKIVDTGDCNAGGASAMWWLFAILTVGRRRSRTARSS